MKQITVSNGFLQLQASFLTKAGRVLDGVMVELYINNMFAVGFISYWVFTRKMLIV